MLKLDSFTNIDQKHFSWKQQGKAVQGSLNNLLNQFRQGNCIFEGLTCPSQGTHGQSDSLFASSNLLVWLEIWAAKSKTPTQISL